MLADACVTKWAAQEGEWVLVSLCASKKNIKVAIMVKSCISRVSKHRGNESDDDD